MRCIAPGVVNQQRASALRFGDPRVQGLLVALLSFRLLPEGFRNRQLRETIAPLLGLSVEQYTQASHDLRHATPGLHGLIERVPRGHRHTVTDVGLRIALCYNRTFARVLRPNLSVAFDAPARVASRIQRAIKLRSRLEHEPMLTQFVAGMAPALRQWSNAERFHLGKRLSASQLRSRPRDAEMGRILPSTSRLGTPLFRFSSPS